MELGLAFKEREDHIDPNIEGPTDDLSKATWQKADGKAKAIIGWSEADDHLERVRDCETAAEMWKVIFDLYQRRIFIRLFGFASKNLCCQNGDIRKVSFLNFLC